MKKVTKPSRAKTLRARKAPPAKLAKPKSPQSSALAETVAQLSRTTDKLARAADKLAEAATKLAAAAEAQHQGIEAPQPSGVDAIPEQEAGASDSIDQQE